MEKTVSIYHLNDNEREFDMEYIFNQYYKRVYNYIFYRVNNHHTAEDLAGDVFKKILVKQKHFSEDKGNFEVWMFTMIRNEINDHIRRKKRKTFLSFDYLKVFQSDEKEPEECVVDSEEKRNLIQALEKLNSKDRNLLGLKYGSELKNVEIAKILGISASNVGVALHRATNRLKEQLEREGF